MIVDYLDYQKLHTGDGSDPDPATAFVPATPSPPATPFFARSAVDSLSGTSASFLMSTSPLRSTAVPPAFKPMTISPQRRTSRYADLLERPAMNAREQELVGALAESEQRDEMRKDTMIKMQAGVVLAGMYVDQAHSQLQAAEERKTQKKGRRKMGDGKAKWFTSDAFIEMCVQDDQRREEEAAGKEGRRGEREARAVELAEWKKKNDVIRERNEVKKQVFEADKAAWEAEKDVAKAAKRRPGWGKPKWKDYGPGKLMPQPKKLVEDEEDESEEGEGNESAAGMEED
ncbi:hypothetical protein DFH08DRAFT_790759 [Mycena albidolilacea]|uniref:Uncharacterized protein n=1 Tax=Mycena albidolilacea TaxID=1033008 RepID=A0AAD7EDG4_9AGAR|nr:hypothetical protein DFH08DRAFT_790759 [Mycena albidolilacea]